MENIAISVENVTKLYKLYDKPSDRFKEALKLTKQKKYKEHYALQNLSFEIKKGECVGIIGTNGAGKSTILKIITGVLNPTDGDVKINGRISALLELGAGFNSEYTGIENVYLNGTMIGFSKEEIDAKMDDILAFADIGDFVYQPVKTYSSGMFVRLAFAVAINIEPEILIVDEALSVGDVFFQAKCYRKFEEFKKMGKTILFVSHDLGSISKYCDKVVLLNKGKKIDEGLPNEMIDLYKKILVNQFDDEDTQDTEQKDYVDNKKGWKENFVINPNTIEYGERDAEIIDFCVVDNKGKFTNTIDLGKEYSIKLKIRFNKKVHDPIIAVSIKNLQGTEICGTNTMYERIFVEGTDKGDERIITFTQKMNLNGGEYLISLGCTGYKGDDFVVYHRLYDVINLSVISDKKSVGFYDIESKITIE